jgi:Iron/zinc purple acid phosphatase-like protein C
VNYLHTGYIILTIFSTKYVYLILHPLHTFCFVGTGGAAFTQNAVVPPPEWNELFLYKWGYARVTAINASHLSWEFVESGSGTVFDRMGISQSTDWTTKPVWSSNKNLIDKFRKKSAEMSGIFLTDFAAFFAGGFVVAAFLVFIALEYFYGFFSTNAEEYKVVGPPEEEEHETAYNAIP